MHVKHTLEVNDDAGVWINKSFLSIVGEAGGFENMQFVERDARNFICHHRRSFCKEGDGQVLLHDFSKMRDLNNEFFYDIEMDEDNRICSVFWADARSRAACDEFGDVVSFDTTYLTNKYDMPFAPFVGVNHHGQSILLGCGLLSSQDTASCIIFRHSLLVLGQEDVDNVLSKYVIRRWSKNIRRRHTLIRAAYSCLHQEPKMQRYQSLCKRFYDITEVVCESESESASVQLENELNCLAKKFGLTGCLKNNIISYIGELRYENPMTDTPSYNTCGSSDVLVRSPVVVKRKGRLRTNKLQSTIETVTKKRNRGSRKNTSTISLDQNVSNFN
ncbi:protein FAR1-RELATED SEQUENCE 3-like [Vigna umbellata]|uniref:protein FAR1-RELATED SEQUENCE 3-like n=1 Tax=Vigna umbellata TaxID=87088 RepID=UPI001F5E37DC|nr:protein FAR1-RELATED SEQUENCE 3-like [Vigna umbellata]